MKHCHYVPIPFTMFRGLRNLEVVVRACGNNVSVNTEAR